jgi:hypothetical protein
VRDELDKKIVEGGRRRRWIRRLAMVVGALVLAAFTLLAVQVATHPSGSPERVLPDQKFALPPKTSGCSGVVSLGNGAFRVPITVSRDGSAAQMNVNVCLDGQGPFPFTIDTGAASSVIDVHLAERLHLQTVGAPQRYAGVGCTSTEQLVQLTTWSVAGLPLASQAIAAEPNPSLGEAGEAVGLLGSDVLSRFGAVRFDFAAQTMTVPGTEGPAPSAARTVRGPLASPIPSTLASGSKSSVVGLAVAEGPSYAEMGTSVQFKRVYGTVEFDVDTGSSQSLVDSSLVPVLNLAKTHFAERGNTVCSRITVPLVQSGRWSMGGIQLSPLMIASSNLGPVGRAGFNGLLGLDELSRFEYAIVDFTGAKLVLGPPDR